MPTMTRLRSTLALFTCAMLAVGCGLGDLPRADTSGGILRAEPERPRSEPATLRVVSWNIERSRQLGAALYEIAHDDSLADADVYLFQEIGSDAAERLVRSTRLAGAHFVASVRPRSGLEFGNTVLARWPILDARRVGLPEASLRRGSPRAATVVDLDVEGTLLRVVSIHTATILLTPRERFEQAEAALENLRDFEGPTVVAGDFNTGLKNDVNDLRALFRDHGFQWVAHGADSTIDTTWWREALLPHHRLDHVFVRGLRVRSAGVVGATEASDHLPLWVLVDWPPEATGD